MHDAQHDDVQRSAQASGKTVGIGLIGTGFMGGQHARAYRSVAEIFPDAARPDVRIVADLRLDDARAFARRFSIPEYTDDWRSLLGRDDLAMIDICTPPILHQEMATAVAEAGKAVFCEKPVGRSLAETRAIWEAVERAGVLSFVGFNYRQAPAVILAQHLLAEGRIGQIRQVRTSFHTCYDSDAERLTPWRWRFGREDAGPGALADLGSHVFDLAMVLAGPIARLCGTTQIMVPERSDPARPGQTRRVDNDDSFAALVEFANGATGVVDASRVAIGSRGEITFDVVGSLGTLRWDYRRMNELQVYLLDRPEAEQGFTTIQTGPANWPYAHFLPSPLGLGYADTKTIEAHRIADAVAAGTQISPNIRDMLGVARLIDAVQRGGWVTIEPETQAVAQPQPA
ncbi:MAG: Gfo/Idh/MocA family oxidoreductase [Chloroflexi bacterium]|nr:Gfo/Idh/MocA family oxidoreductase [Chloroflexota bacterium]